VTCLIRAIWLMPLKTWLGFSSFGGSMPHMQYLDEALKEVYNQWHLLFLPAASLRLSVKHPRLTYADTAKPKSTSILPFLRTDTTTASTSQTFIDPNFGNQSTFLHTHLCIFPLILNQAPTHCLWAAAKSSLEEGMSHVKQKEDKKCSPYSHLR